MNEYTIYCTEEQTKKAFDLGASIEDFDPDRNNGFGYKGKALTYPTAEQMLCWLEEQDGIEEIDVCKTVIWIWGKDHTPIKFIRNLSSRRESSLAAVDAALEYLIKNKK